MSQPKLLLIIPFFNEASRIENQELPDAFLEYNDVDFLLVNDGSNDSTGAILDKLLINTPNVQVLHLSPNTGKGEAIRRGVLHTDINTYAYIGYLDADLATPVEELVNMKLFADKNEQYLFFMGSRIKKLGSNITRYTYRHYFGRIFATIVSKVILKAAVYDTQCGAKIIEGRLAQELFEQPFYTKWLFDIELLLRYRKKDPLYLSKVYEYALGTWTEKGNSKIKLTDLIALPLQLIKVANSYGK
jgi:glycosyltransferase involved in cell wall biosynthesis